jgi:hypothetical protein
MPKGPARQVGRPLGHHMPAAEREKMKPTFKVVLLVVSM